MEDIEKIVRVATILEGLVLEVKGLSLKIDDLKDGHVQDTNTAIKVLESQVRDIIKDRDNEKSKNFYLTLAVITEGLALISSIIMYFVLK